MQIIVLFKLLPSMKGFLKIAELNHLRQVNEYKVFYHEIKFKRCFYPFLNFIYKGLKI